ncbi:MAG: glutathione S-transferase [Gammaproteobacteria bacterium]|nr:MAG: glutathione S-transferase [Gammaproteobacteria bacterium]
MLTITALYAGLLGLIFIALSFKIVGIRKSKSIGIGDGGNEKLQLACRVQANFAEYVPIALILLAILELNSWASIYVHIIGASFVVGRLLHAWGYGKSSGSSLGRVSGILLTWIMIIALSGLNIYSAILGL